MRIVRFASDGKARYGMLDGNIGSEPPTQSFRRLRSIRHSSPKFDGNHYRLDEVKTPRPMRTPSKVVCLGVNYRSHAIETGLPIPSVPLIFLKPPTAVIGPEEKIVLPRLEKRRVDYEAELGIVIGRRTKEISQGTRQGVRAGLHLLQRCV